MAQFSICFVEAWRPRETWIKLNIDDRKAYVDRLMGYVQSVLDDTIEVVTWSLDDLDVNLSSDMTHFAVYKITSMGSLDALKNAIDESGWYDYFDQVEYAGHLNGPPNILQQLINLE
ncbi:MAG: hypothetical protein GXP16_04220 [Gammaproteobacteria bacterium]|nr:hypothetical protein [Gammaproteobacteria bacterium]